jgi:ATP-dependent RNA helicase RhlE
LNVTFKELQLIEPVLQALHEEGYTNPTPIQQQSIPPVLAHRDLLGCAQTGTGKTAAFAIPILQHMHQHETPAHGKRQIRALVLTPTRELAIQIEESFRAYGRHLPLRTLVIFGGVSQVPQVQALHKGVDILVATPGRLLDLMNQRQITLEHVRYFVLDEADRMLDMGFVHDVKRVIAKLPTRRQTLFFSATMPKEIQQLADSILHEPVKVEVTPVSSTAETVGQQIFFVDKKSKTDLLVHLMEDAAIKTALVFSRTKHGADRIAKNLVRSGIRAAAIHGDKSQNARQNALNDFKVGKLRILVATDIAARGIDIDELGHVFNFDLPNVPETYVHRIGRTGRAGASGRAYSFCDMEEREYLRDIEKLIHKKIPVVENHPYVDKGFTGENRPATAVHRPGGQKTRTKPSIHRSAGRSNVQQQATPDTGRSSSGTWNRSAAGGRNKSATGRPEFRQHAGANHS